jgi:hypothetical protein
MTISSEKDEQRSYEQECPAGVYMTTGQQDFNVDWNTA